MTQATKATVPTSVSSTTLEPSYSTIVRQAWPAILANAAVPLLGIADTALVTYVGGTQDLGAVALSVLVFNSLYWALGFIRMSTTGMAAQALGANDEREVQRIVKRAMVVGVMLGLALIALKGPIANLSLRLLSPEPDVKALAHTYIEYRIWSAPAVFINYAVTGVLIALGRMRLLLVLQLFLNVSNLVANLGLVLVVRGSFEGVRGIALGTACAEWVAAGLAVYLLPKVGIAGLGSVRAWLADVGQATSARTWRGLFLVNLNILLRTFALLLGFAWFTRAGAQFGSSTLAANHLLQQFVSFAAFFLDGVAFVTESFVGRAVGARDEALLRRSVNRANLVALGFAGTLASCVWAIGPFALEALAPTNEVRRLALAHLPLASAYVLIGVIPWQLDGIFIGAARGAALRNAAVVSLVVFWVAATTLSTRYGNTGLWCAMLIYITMRGLTLLAHWPEIVRLTRTKAATPSRQ